MCIVTPHVSLWYTSVVMIIVVMISVRSFYEFWRENQADNIAHSIVYLVVILYK